MIEMVEFRYRANHGQIERAFCVRPFGIPGHDVYIDFEEGVVVHEWNLFGVYRVTPWLPYQ